MGLFGALSQIAETANARPPEGADADASIRRHANYHRRIVLVGTCFAAVGVLVGLLVAISVAGDANSGRDIKGMLMAPLMFGAGGFVFGMALMCLFAPRAFLSGPVGAPWMKLIGTESVLVARIVCLLFGLIVTAPVVGIGLLIAFSK